MSEPRSPLVVAAVQATPVPGDVAGNAVLGARLVADASRRDARVAVLPELFLCAYHPPTLYATSSADVMADAGGRIVDARLDPLVDAARDGGVAVVVGAAVRHEDGRRTCSSLLVDVDGTVMVRYDKQNLWGPDERALFTPGTRGASVDVDGWRLGLGICYDGCFPEHGRAAAVRGAHAYLCPSGYLVGSEHRRDLYYAARALDNTMYVVFANSVGTGNAVNAGDPVGGGSPWTFNGGAAIYEPEGRALVRAPNEGTCVVTAQLDPAELARVRAAHTMLRDHPRAATASAAV